MMEFSFKQHELFKILDTSPEDMILWVAFGYPISMLFITLVIKQLLSDQLYKKINSILWPTIILSWISSIVVLLILFITKVSGLKLLLIWILSVLISLIFSIINKVSISKFYNDLVKKVALKNKSKL